MLNSGLAYSDNTYDPRGLLLLINDRISLLIDIFDEIITAEIFVKV